MNFPIRVSPGIAQAHQSSSLRATSRSREQSRLPKLSAPSPGSSGWRAGTPGCAQCAIDASGRQDDAVH